MLNLKWRIAQFTELKWWQSYLNKKDKIKYYEWKNSYWQNLLQQLPVNFQETNNLNILDAGCGPAGVFIALTNHNITAFDPLLDSYQKKLNHFESNDFSWVSFENKSLENFTSISNKPFDVVFCMNAINHVADIGKSYDVLVKHLKKGGLLVVTIDAHNYSFYKNLFRALPGDILHPHQYDLQEYRQFMTNRGINIDGEHLIKKEYFFNHYMLWGYKA